MREWRYGSTYNYSLHKVALRNYTRFSVALPMERSTGVVCITGVLRFSKNLVVKSRRQLGWMGQFPPWCPTNFVPHRVKFIRPGELATGIYAPQETGCILRQILLIWKWLKILLLSGLESRSPHLSCSHCSDWAIVAFLFTFMPIP
jgi:hypothetical protein